MTTIELSPDPTYDPDANKPWWELAWNAVVKWFASVVQWFHDLDIGWKIGIGVTLLAFALLLTIVTSGGFMAVEAWIAAGQMMLQFAIGVVSATAISMVMALASGESIPDALVHGLADGIFWGGVFAFVSASVNAIKTGVRAIKNAKAISQVNYDSEFLNWLNQGEANNVVYKGVSDGGNNVYTGITKQKLSVRLCQHNRVGKNFIRLDTIYTDLTRNQARSIETYLIINDGASNMNKILSISRNSKFFSQAMSWASNLIGRG